VNLLSLKIIFKYALILVAGIAGLAYLRIFTAALNPEIFYAIGAVIFVAAGIYIGTRHKKNSAPPVSEALPKNTLPPLNTILSRRELEVLDALLLNKSNPEIAQNLYISESTLKTHITRIYKKLEVKNRKELFSAIPNYPGYQQGK
jgi:DNA-binding CsgD family transcriptional regulator